MRTPDSPRTTGVTVRGVTVSIWSLNVHPALTACTGGASVPFGPRAQAAWRAATLALPRCLPVLWRSVHDASRDLPSATFLGAHLAAPGFEERDRILDGPSFGLAFFLLQACAALDVRLPEDVLATAAIDERGRVLPVDALPDKIRGVVASSPSIRRVLVAADQRDEAIRAADEAVAVVAVADAGEALRHLFGDALSARLVEAGSDPEQQAELVDAFFRLAIVGRGASVDWSPVERGAALALSTWPLDEAARYRLQFACAVAARHERNAGDVPLPDASWLAQQPATLRLSLLTHLVQQSADAGTPAWRDTEMLAEQSLPDRFEGALVPHLKLMGALARLWAVTGREAQALARQQQVAEAFVAAYAEPDTSFPLAEWFRLSGVLGDRVAFDAADTFRARAMTKGGFGLHGLPYVDLARARAMVVLGRPREAVGGLKELYADDALPEHVRWSAARWLVAALLQLERTEAAGAVTHDMRRAASTARTAARYVALAELDAALNDSATCPPDHIIHRLQVLDPGPIGHLLAVSTDPAFIARAYPY